MIYNSYCNLHSSDKTSPKQACIESLQIVKFLSWSTTHTVINIHQKNSSQENSVSNSIFPKQNIHVSNAKNNIWYWQKIGVYVTPHHKMSKSSKCNTSKLLQTPNLHKINSQKMSKNLQDFKRHHRLPLRKAEIRGHGLSCWVMTYQLAVRARLPVYGNSGNKVLKAIT